MNFGSQLSALMHQNGLGPFTQVLGLSDSIYKTTSGAEFRCRRSDEDKMKLLSCSLCSGSPKAHIVEGRSLKNRKVRDQAILDMRPRDLPGAETPKDYKLPADIQCVKELYPTSYKNYGEDQELTILCQDTTVFCAKNMTSASRSFLEFECANAVSLSDLPYHYENAHRCSLPRVAEPLGAHAAAPVENYCQLGRFSQRPSGSENERSLDGSLQTQVSMNKTKIERLEAIIAEQADTISELQRMVNSISLSCAEHRFTIKELKEQSLIDGTFLWEIEDFKDAFFLARRGGETSTFSEIFYANGYRMSVKLFPNGDGAGLGTHVSLFLVIMKGKYDNVLAWPFNQQFSFEILGDGGDVLWSERYLPELNSSLRSMSCFQKPRQEMNEPIGCPQAIALDDLALRMSSDGSLYVKVKIGDKATNR
ncbi:hypothetical protein [Endozoicomonas sp. ONNA2]|uniref:hypothetical protein n=1 Tax=Endozoicomonas sp. ONNA2 TaxID=2828741 RepID=UPI002147D141|nr:hypothetical protein [Endozoicomonas sp. ONNA2]